MRHFQAGELWLPHLFCSRSCWTLCRMAWPHLHWCKAAGSSMSEAPGTLYCSAPWHCWPPGGGMECLALAAKGGSQWCRDAHSNWQGMIHAGSSLHCQNLGAAEVFSTGKPAGFFLPPSMGFTESPLLSLMQGLSFSLGAIRHKFCRGAGGHIHTAMRSNYLDREPCVDHWEILTAGNKPILNYQSKNQCLCKIQWYF